MLSLISPWKWISKIYYQILLQEFDSLVIQDSNISYLSPVDSDFFAISNVSDTSTKHLFDMLKKKGVGRIEVGSSIGTEKQEIDKVRFKKI